MPYFRSFVANSQLNDLEDIYQGHGHCTRHTMLWKCDLLCQMWKESMQNSISCKADTIRYAIFLAVYCKIRAQWPWYRSSSKIVAHNTLSLANVHLCQILKESNQNCTCCRSDTGCAIFLPSNCKVMTEWPWRYWSRSKVTVCDTSSYAGDHLRRIWNASNQNWKLYRADTKIHRRMSSWEKYRKNVL